MKFTALDQSMKVISLNDTARVSEGPSKVLTLTAIRIFCVFF